MDDIFLQLSKLTESKPDEVSKTSIFNERYKPTSEDLFVYDELVVPDLKPKRSASGKPIVVAIDDDFSTLDLMKIYLQRDYEFMSFDNPKEAIFWLNTNIPDLIFIDCFLNMMSTKKTLEIIRSNKSASDVPIYYLCEPDELAAICDRLPDGVTSCLTRPIGRGKLQEILDEVFKNRPQETPAEEIEVSIFDALELAEQLKLDDETDG